MYCMHAFVIEHVVTQPFNTEILGGTYVPTFKTPADNVVHETVTLLAFTPEMLTIELFKTDALLQLKLRKLAVNPHTEFNDTLLNLHVCILALLEKIVVQEHVVIQLLTKLAALPFIIKQNDVLRFQKHNDTEAKQLDNELVIMLDRLLIEA